ncbi:MAG: hypothetical protein ACREA2_04810 [Blastocatellia bacterium]
MQRSSKHAWFKSCLMLICLLGGAATTFTDRALGKAGAASSPIQPQFFSASGRVTTTLREPDSGRTREAGVSGVTVKFEIVSGTGATPAPAQTDAGGNWNQSGFAPGVTYKATPSRSGFFFTPVSVNFSNLVKPIRDRIGLNFAAHRQLEIASSAASGRVSTNSGRGVSGIEVRVEFNSRLGGGQGQLNAITDSNGAWSMSLPNALSASQSETFRVRLLSFFRFDPPERQFTRANASRLDFKLPDSFSVNGSIAIAADHPQDQRPLPDVHIRFTDVSGGSFLPAKSDAKGNFSIQNLSTGRGYRVTAEKQGLTCRYPHIVRAPQPIPITCTRN